MKHTEQFQLLSQRDIAIAFGIAWIGLLTSPSAGQEAQVWTELSIGPAGSSLAYSGCSPDECFGEAITVVLGCETSDRVGARATILLVGDHVQSLASKVLASDYDQHQVTLNLGRTTVTGPIYGLDLARNDMDGGWIVTLVGGYDFNQFFAALAPPNTEGEVALDAFGWTYDLKPNTDDASKLQTLGEECLKLLAL